MCRSQFKNLLSKKSLIEKKQDAFATVGYEGNNHTIKKFCNHENSILHLRRMELHSLHVRNQQLTQAELNLALKLKQKLNRKCFLNSFMIS